MIIGTDNIDYDKVIGLSDDYNGLCEYIRSLVPEQYRHVEAIYNNTRYYINTMILENSSLSLDKKMAITKLLTKNIRVVGYTDVYITCGDLERRINMKRVNSYYEGDKYE